MSTVVEYADAATDTDQSFDFKAISGQIGIDKAQGIVEAFVSGIGNKDSVGDVVVSGAFNESLKRRKPRVVWGHDWNQPIGKVLEIYEVSKSDPRLPDKMKNAGIGGLFAKVQFNLNTERGREAFANVAFYGMDQEWSIGYKTLTADFDASRQANVLKEVELYEISPVLHGANQLTGTISVKDDNDATSSKGEGSRMDSIENPHANSADAASVMMGRLLSQALKKPVQILEVSGNRVVFQTAPDSMWMATFTREGEQVMVGKPTQVKPTTSYTPISGEKPPVMLVKEPESKDAEEPAGIRDADDDLGSWPLEVALAWATTLGCVGTHSEGGGHLPCSSPEEYKKALEKFDGNANINAHNNYLAGAEVSESKDAMGCSCSSDEKEHVAPTVRPSFPKDPMTLLLMAYNEMLKMRGGGKLRNSMLALINDVEEFMTSEGAPSEYPPKPNPTSGFVVHVKCKGTQAFDVSSVMAGIPVFVFKSEEGVDLHFAAGIEHTELLKKVATALAGLEFDPSISVSKPVDTDAGVK